MSDLTNGVYSISSVAFNSKPSVLFEGTGENVAASVATFDQEEPSFQWEITSVDPAKKTYTIQNKGNTSYPKAVAVAEAVVSASSAKKRNWIIAPTGASDEYTISYIGTDSQPIYWILPSATSNVTLSSTSTAGAQKNWIFHKVATA